MSPVTYEALSVLIETGAILCESAYTELDIPYDTIERDRIINKNFPTDFMI